MIDPNKIDKKPIVKKRILINGQEIPNIGDISKLPWFIKKFIDQDNNGKIDVIEKAEKDGLIEIGTGSSLQTPTNQIAPSQNEPADPFKRPDINRNPSQNKNPILVPQDEVENKMRIVGIILLGGVVAYILYRFLV